MKNSQKASTENCRCFYRIGATGFEPATSRPPAERATKLRHTPGTEIIIPETGKKATGKYRQKHTEKEKDPQIPQVLSIFYKTESIRHVQWSYGTHASSFSTPFTARITNIVATISAMAIGRAIHADCTKPAIM